MTATPKKGFKIALGADHAGFEIKFRILKFLTSQGYRIVDFGTHSGDSTDYPDYAVQVARTVAAKKCDRGILVCGTGLGMAIAANKIKGIRAAACWNPAVAKLASQHNWCNVLCLPGRFVSAQVAKNIVKSWILTPFDNSGRHGRRVKKILKIESKINKS